MFRAYFIRPGLYSGQVRTEWGCSERENMGPRRSGALHNDCAELLPAGLRDHRLLRLDKRSFVQECAKLDELDLQKHSASSLQSTCGKQSGP